MSSLVHSRRGVGKRGAFYCLPIYIIGEGVQMCILGARPPPHWGTATQEVWIAAGAFCVAPHIFLMGFYESAFTAIARMFEQMVANDDREFVTDMIGTGVDSAAAAQVGPASRL